MHRIEARQSYMQSGTGHNQCAGNNPYFRFRIGPLVPNPVYQEVNTLLRRPFTKVVIQRQNNAGATVHAPEKHTDPVFG